MSARNSTAELFRFVFYRLWRRKPVSIARGIWINLTSLKRINLIKIHRVEITCKIGKRNVPIRPIYNQFVDRTNSYWNAADLLYSTRFNQFDSLRWFDLRRQSVDWNVQFQIKKDCGTQQEVRRVCWQVKSLIVDNLRLFKSSATARRTDTHAETLQFDVHVAETYFLYWNQFQLHLAGCWLCF